MNHWSRIRSAVRGAQGAIAAEPKHLASIKPLIEDALTILSKPPSSEAIDELEYLIGRAQDFVSRWRPSPRPTPGVFYTQPLWARSTDEQAGEALSLIEEFRAVYSATPASQEEVKSMKAFISHSSSDAAIAEALVELLRAALTLPAKEIRCTSVDGYKLPAGADSNEQLRQEVFASEAFVALLSPASVRSVYVMFELGARWGTGQPMVPIMVGGLNVSDLKAPLSAIHAISGTSESDLHELVEQLADRLQRPLEKPSAYGKALRAFMVAAAPLPVTA